MKRTRLIIKGIVRYSLRFINQGSLDYHRSGRSLEVLESRTLSNSCKEFEPNTINQFVRKSNVVAGVLLATQLTTNLFKLNQDGPMEMLAIVQMLPMELFSVSED